MGLKSLTPNLMVNDVEETIEYYTDILGFTLLMTVPETGKLDWAMVKRNDVVIMFQSSKNKSSSFNPKSVKDNFPVVGDEKLIFISP